MVLFFELLLNIKSLFLCVANDALAQGARVGQKAHTLTEKEIGQRTMKRGMG